MKIRTTFPGQEPKTLPAPPHLVEQWARCASENGNFSLPLTEFVFEDETEDARLVLLYNSGRLQNFLEGGPMRKRIYNA